jgi:hypothetical protein
LGAIAGQIWHGFGSAKGQQRVSNQADNQDFIVTVVNLGNDAVILIYAQGRDRRRSSLPK